MIKLKCKDCSRVVDVVVGKVDLHTAGVVTSWGHVIPLDHVILFGMKRKMEPAAYLGGI